MYLQYPIGENIEKIGPDLANIDSVNTFWTDVFSAYKHFGKAVQVTTLEEFCSEPLFCNSHIKIENRPIYYNNWIRGGVLTIGDLVNDDGKLMSYPAFIERYSSIADFVSYYGVLGAVRKFAKITGVIFSRKVPAGPNKLRRHIGFAPKGARRFYDILLFLVKDVIEPNCCGKWKERLVSEVYWKKTFQMVKKIKDVKLKWFQMRLIHRIIGTNVILQKMNIVDSDKCSFCHLEKESIQHIFWKCQHVQTFWDAFEKFVNEKCEIVNLHLTEIVVLFGCGHQFKSDDIFDLILLLAKFFIYKCKCENKLPQIQHFICYLRNRFVIEKYVSYINMSHQQFTMQWLLYTPIFQ